MKQKYSVRSNTDVLYSFNIFCNPAQLFYVREIPKRHLPSSPLPDELLSKPVLRRQVKYNNVGFKKKTRHEEGERAAEWGIMWGNALETPCLLLFRLFRRGQGVKTQDDSAL